MAKRYWLMKSEPDVFSFDDLLREENQTAYWEGVRNYQARNFMRDDMKVGDGVLFYHSNAKPPHVAGVAKVVKAGYPDFTAFDPDAKYFDPKSDPENPRWYMVDIQAIKKFASPVSLSALKENPALDGMLVTRRGQRLSIQPVERAHFDEVVRMGKGAR